MTALVLALLGCAGPARAETVVLLPAGGDDFLRAEKGAARAELRKALVDQGVRVISRREAADAARGRAATCDRIDCAHELVRAVDADVAAGIGVFAGDGGERAGKVFVTLVDRGGVRFPGHAVVEDGDVRMAARAALLDARALQLLGPGPWLHVLAKIEGADVLVDGELVGSTPYRAPVAAGRHTLEVRAEGHRPHVQSIDVPSDEVHQLEVRARLGRRRPGAASDADTAADYDDGFGDDGPSIVGPLLLGAMGTGIVVADVVYLTGAGCAKQHANGTCLKRERVDSTMAIAWGAVGMAAMAGAVLWYILDGDPDNDQDATRVRIGPGSLAVTGTF